MPNPAQPLGYVPEGTGFDHPPGSTRSGPLVDIPPTGPVSSPEFVHSTQQLDELVQKLRQSSSSQRAALWTQWVDAYGAYDALRVRLEHSSSAYQRADFSWIELVEIANAPAERHAYLLDRWVEKPWLDAALKRLPSGGFFIHAAPSSRDIYQFSLRHKSRSGNIVASPIVQDDDGQFRLRIEDSASPPWQPFKTRRFASLGALADTLKSQLRLFEIKPLPPLPTSPLLPARSMSSSEWSALKNTFGAPPRPAPPQLPRLAVAGRTTPLPPPDSLQQLVDAVDALPVVDDPLPADTAPARATAQRVAEADGTLGAPRSRSSTVADSLASVPVAISPNKPSAYTRQVVLQLQDEDTVRAAAQALDAKHPEISQLARWDSATQAWRIDGADAPHVLDSDSRLIVVGHGTRDADGTLRMGGLTAQELGARLAKALPAGGIRTLALVGCDLVDEIPHTSTSGALPQGFVGDLLQTLPARAVGTVHVHPGKVRVDAQGHRNSGVPAADGSIDWRNDKLSIGMAADGQYRFRRIPGGVGTPVPPPDAVGALLGDNAVHPTARAIMASRSAIKTVITQAGERDRANVGAADHTISLEWFTLHQRFGELIAQLDRYATLPPQRQNSIEGYLALKSIAAETRTILASPEANDKLGLGEADMSRVALNTFRDKVSAGIAALETPVPKTLHFVWLGRLDATAKEHIAFWAARNPDYAIQLWHDPDALLVNELRQRIVKQAHAEFNDPRTGLNRPGLEERIIAMQDQVQDFIDDYRQQHLDQSFDDAVQAYMQQHLGVDAAELARIRAEHRQSFTELGALSARVVLKDINTLDFTPNTRAAYQQERDLRNHPAAMSDIVRLHVLEQYGGLYLDSSLLPRLNPQRFTAPAAAAAADYDSDTTYSNSEAESDNDSTRSASDAESDSDMEKIDPARRQRTQAQARAAMLQDPGLAALQTQIALDELARQGQIPQYAEHRRSGRYADLTQVFEARYGAAATELVAHYRQAVVGQTAEQLFVPLGEVRVGKGGIAVLDSQNSAPLNSAPENRRWLNAAIAAAPKTPMLRHSLQEIGYRYHALLSDPVLKAHYRHDGFQSSDQPRPFSAALPGNLALSVETTGRTTTILTGLDALKASVASHLSQQRILPSTAPMRDRLLAQLLSPLANPGTPLDRQSAGRTGIADRPANLYAEGSRYAQQLVLQLGDDNVVTDAARYLHNKHQATSRWLRLDAADGQWRDAVTGDVYVATDLPANSRVSVIGHGETVGGQQRLGGLDGDQLALPLSRVLPAGHALQTLRLVGCNPREEGSRPFVKALWQGLDTWKRRVDAMHIGGEGLTQVDVFGRKWGLHTSANPAQYAWTQTSEKLVMTRQGDGKIDVVVKPPQPADPRGQVPPGASGTLGKPAPDAPPAPRIRTAHRLLGASGTGMRLFGTYRSFNAVRQAVQQGKYTEASIAAGGFTLNLGSEAAERGMQRLGTHLLRRGVVSGRLALRAAPLFNLATVPWDIYDAKRNFDQAGKLSGKARQDALVQGGFAVASLSGTVIVTGLALAGGSIAAAAGPVGLAIGAGLIAANQAYVAYRQVEDIARWLPLSWQDKLQEGARAFVGMEVSSETQARTRAAQLTEQLNQNVLRQTQTKLAEQQLALVIGPLLVAEARDYQRRDEQGTTPLAAAADHAHPHVWLGHRDNLQDLQAKQSLCKAPLQSLGVAQHILDARCPLDAPTLHDQEVFIADSDDTVDLARGVDALSEAQRGKLNIARADSPGNKPVWFDFGNGNDTLQGVRDAPNRFRLGSGSKTVSGGRLDDLFHLDAMPAFGAADSLHHDAARQAQAQRLAGYRYEIDGGEGEDTLMLATDFAGSDYQGYDIDLASGRMALLLPSQEGHAPAIEVIGQLRNVEHILTAPNARLASQHRLYGTAQSNRLAGRARDRLEGREGHDSYAVSLADPGDQVSVRDHNLAANGAEQWSTVLLDQPLDQLAAWSLAGDALRLHAANGATLTLEAVYREGQLVNNRFAFYTIDGFLLTPRLPAKAADFASLAVDAAYLPAADATLAATTAGIALDLAQGTLQRGEQLQQVAAPHRLRMAGGTARDDAFVGTAGNDTFMASAGHDRFEGRGGDDQYVIDDTAGQADIDTGRGDGVSTLLFAQARLHELTLRGDGGPDLLIDTPHGKTVRHKDSGNAAALIAIDPEGAQLSWLMNPDSLQLDNVTQSAAIQGSRLRSHGAQSNLLVGRRGDDRLDARHSGTVFKGGDGADIYSIEAAGDFLIDNQADDGREDVLHWHGAGQGEQQPLRFERAGEHLILSDDTGASSVTLAGYFAAGGAARHLRIEFQRPDGEVDTLSAADLDSSAQAAPTIELGTLDRQLQRLIEASGRFGAADAPALTPTHDAGRVAPLLATPA